MVSVDAIVEHELGNIDGGIELFRNQFCWSQNAFSAELARIRTKNEEEVRYLFGVVSQYGGGVVPDYALEGIVTKIYGARQEMERSMLKIPQYKEAVKKEVRADLEFFRKLFLRTTATSYDEAVRQAFGTKERYMQAVSQRLEAELAEIEIILPFLNVINEITPTIGATQEQYMMTKELISVYRNFSGAYIGSVRATEERTADRIFRQ